MTQIIEIMCELSKKLGVPVLTSQYEIMLTLLECGDLTAEQLIQRSSSSRAGFFNTIDRLKMWGIVVSTTSPADRRNTLYRLEESARDLIISRFDQYRLSHISLGSLGIHQSDLATMSNRVRIGRKLDHLSCEFQILLYLYLLPGTSNSDLKVLVDSSGTKFNLTLGKLVNGGLVYFTRNKQDQRRKLYYISSAIGNIMDKAHRDVFEWLETKQAAGDLGRRSNIALLGPPVAERHISDVHDPSAIESVVRSDPDFSARSSKADGHGPIVDV